VLRCVALCCAVLYGTSAALGGIDEHQSALC